MENKEYTPIPTQTPSEEALVSPIPAPQPKRNRRGLFAAAAVVIVGITAIIITAVVFSIRNAEAQAVEDAYNAAVETMKQGDYQLAAEQFEKLGDYRNSQTMKALALNDVRYAKAFKLALDGDYAAAAAEFHSLSGFEESNAFASACEKYVSAVKKIQSGDYQSAIKETNGEDLYLPGEKIGAPKKIVTFDTLLKENMSEYDYQTYKDDLQNYAGVYYRTSETAQEDARQADVTVDTDKWTFTIAVYGTDVSFPYQFTTSEATYPVTEENKTRFVFRSGRRSILYSTDEAIDVSKGMKAGIHWTRTHLDVTFEK